MTPPTNTSCAPCSTAAAGPRGLVGHDAGGPDAIEYALREPGWVDQLILLNTYYGHASTLRLPEAIRLLADPELRPLADPLLEDPNLRLWRLGHTARRFGLDPDDPSGVAVTAVAPQFFGDADRPDALAAVRAWTAALFPSLHRQDAQIAAGHLAALEVPVTLVFGAADNYLNPDLGRRLTGCRGVDSYSSPVTGAAGREGVRDGRTTDRGSRWPGRGAAARRPRRAGPAARRGRL